MRRLETGIAQEGEDTLGIFVRRDLAWAYSEALGQALNIINPSNISPIHLALAENLWKLLRSCDPNTEVDSAVVQHVSLVVRPEDEKTA